MKQKSFSILLILLIVFQANLLALNVNDVKSENDSVTFNFYLESDNILPSDFRSEKRPVNRIVEYKEILSDQSIQFDKGSSLFFIHNQLLPKSLINRKIFIVFSNSYFSSAV